VFNSGVTAFPLAVLNMIPDREPTGFCNSEPDRTGFRKNSTGSDLDIQIALITAVKCLIRVFSGYQPDWIKYLDSISGLWTDRTTQWQWCSLETPFFQVSVSNVSGLVLVSNNFGLGLELLVSRLCMNYFFMKSCKKQLL